MNLDKVTAELRPRGPWEAADLGVRLVRRDAVAIYKAWFAVSLPFLALALAMIYFTPWAGYAFLLYWWFEPVMDGPVLDIIARRLFGGDANVRQTIRSTARFAWRNKLFWLTPWRFHFARSVAMPLTQLEGLSGQSRRERASVLNNHVLNHGIGITIVYQHLVIVVFIGVMLLAAMFVPAEYQDTDTFDAIFSIFEGEDKHATAIQLLLFYIAQTLLEPWFVGGGFGLYINCRTRLEAWDIEVAFRRMAARRQAGLSGALSVLLAVGVLLLAGSPVIAQDDEAYEGDPGFAGFWADEEIDGELEAVMADEVFGAERRETNWVPKRKSEPKFDSPSGPTGIGEFFEQLGLFLSFVAEFGLWILLAGLLLLLYLKRDTWLPYLYFEPRTKTERQRVILSTGEVTAETLPADVPGTVRSLWRAGRQREALSLLYRASVFALVDRYGVRLPPSATEGGCLAAVNAQAEDSQREHFSGVVDVWVRLAYGARTPDDEQVELLINGWTARYGGAAT